MNSHTNWKKKCFQTLSTIQNCKGDSGDILIPAVLFSEKESECDTELSVDGVVGLGLEETVGLLRGQCVCLSVACMMGVDQSEVVLETVTAPNLLYQLPSVLTDTVSFSTRNCHQPLYRLSRPVSTLSRCVFVFATHACIFFTLIFYAIQWRSCSWAGFPYQIFLFQVSFLCVICVNGITVSIIVFKFSRHVSYKTRQFAFPAQIFRILIFQIWLFVFPPLW